MKKNIFLTLILSLTLFTNTFAMEQMNLEQKAGSKQKERSKKRDSRQAGLSDVVDIIQEETGKDQEKKLREDEQESQKQIDRFSLLPDKALLKILDNLSPKEIINLFKTNNKRLINLFKRINNGSFTADSEEEKKLFESVKNKLQFYCLGNFAQLPDELLLKIFKDLSVKDIIRISQTCERFRKLLYSNPITHEIVNRILEIELVSKRHEKLAPRQGDADLNDFITVATELERKFPQLHKSLEALAKRLLIDLGYQLDKIDMEKIEMHPEDLFSQKFMEEYIIHCVSSCGPSFMDIIKNKIINNLRILNLRKTLALSFCIITIFLFKVYCLDPYNTNKIENYEKCMKECQLLFEIMLKPKKENIFFKCSCNSF